MAVDPTLTKVRQRASHRKSRGGCITCKQRHRKCDETLPVCKRCQASGRTCIRASDADHPQSKSQAFRGFRIIQYNIPNEIQRVGMRLPENSSLEYFTVHTLPFLQKCQPSALWTRTIQQLIESHDCFRIIASAVGRQQRLASDKALLDASPLAEDADADTQYMAAVRSLRSCVTTDDFCGDALLPALACLLMVILESLRESPTGVLAHLRCGVQLVSREGAQSSSTEFIDAVRLIRQVSVGAMLCPPGDDRPTNGIGCLMWRTSKSHVFPEEPDASEADLGYVSGELTELISCLLFAHYSRDNAPDTSAAHFEFYAAISHLWQRLDRIEEMLETCRDSVPEEKRIYYELLNSRSAILHEHLFLAWNDSSRDSDLHQTKTEYVLRRLQSCISLLENSGYGASFPFSIGTGLIPTLYLVANLALNSQIRNRVTSLIARCPSREGLWIAKEQIDLLNSPVTP